MGKLKEERKFVFPKILILFIIKKISYKRDKLIKNPILSKKGDKFILIMEISDFFWQSQIARFWSKLNLIL